MPDPFPTLDAFGCFACSPDHPKGLRLRFYEPSPGTVRSDFVLAPDFEGLGGVAHGGIVATVFDEAMAWCLYRNLRAVFVTASMEQRFRDRVPVGAPLAVEASLAEGTGSRRVRVAARLFRTDAPRRTLAQGKALYVRAPERILDDLPEAQRHQLEALFSTFEREVSGATGTG